MERMSSRNEEYPPPEKMMNHAHNLSTVTLSEDIIDQIISFLSIKEAIQNSVLSKRFVNSWKQSKHLCFDSLFAREHPQERALNIIDQVVTLHSSNKIESFQLCINTNNIEPAIISWLNIVSSKEPKLVDIDFSMSHAERALPMKIPFEYLDIESIETLKLSYCGVRLPYNFKGLSFLRNLVLWHMDLSSSFIKTICDNCSLLESIEMVLCRTFRHLKVDATALKYFKVLKIGDCYELDHPHVDAPSLEVFHFVGKPHDLTFGSSVLKLQGILLNYRDNSGVLARHKTKELMLKFSHIRILTINSTLLEDFCKTFNHGVNTGSRQYFWYLKELYLIMEATSFCNPYDIVNFVDKCPLVERLFIDMKKFNFDASNQFWIQRDSKEFDKYDKQFPFLKLVKLSNFSFSDLELKLAKFFLQKALNLENFAIFTRKIYRSKSYVPISNDFLQQLMPWRSSLSAKVGVYKPTDKENKVLIPTYQQSTWY